VIDAACKTPLTDAQLLEYWLDGVAADAEDVLEEHVFACDRCARRLEEIVGLADAVRQIVRSGGTVAVLTRAFVERLRQDGVRVREYRVEPGEGVNCTITPEDDLVVSRLRAPLEGVARLDVVVHDPGERGPVRLQDVPFDPGAAEIFVAPLAASLRRLGTVVQRMELIAVDDSRERQLGVYTFNHTPYAR